MRHTLLGLTLIFLIISGCSRSNLVRVRATMSGMEQGKAEQLAAQDIATAGTQLDAQSAQSEGFGLHLVTRGILLGGSTLTTTFEGETSSGSTSLIRETSTLKANFTEVGFVIGENFTWGFGVGAISGGTLETQLDYGYSGSGSETLKSSDVGGTSSFFMLGHHGFGFETVFGLRWSVINAHYADWDSSLSESLRASRTIEMSPDPKFQTTTAFLGLGFVF